MIIDGYELIKTCIACPEQYAVYDGYRQVGYLRLRHGDFSVYYPDHKGVAVMSAEPKGDGSFDPDERQHYLERAVRALKLEDK